MRFVLTGFLVVFMTVAYAQQLLQPKIGDIVTLEIAIPEGYPMQWQTSADQQNWSDVVSETESTLNTSVQSLPVYYRLKVEIEGCGLSYSETIGLIDIPSTGSRWSDPETWGGTKPKAGDVVTIPSDKHIYLDEDSPELGGLNVAGTLSFARIDVNLTSEWIMVDGVLEVGSETNPFTQKAIITLTDTDMDEEVGGMGTRGIVARMGGSLELHGQAPDITWTKLDAHAANGTKEISVVEEVDWSAGDELVIAPTDFYLAAEGASVSQRITLAELDGQDLTLDESLNAFRWGLLQYPTESGMSLTNESVLSPPLPDTDSEITPLVLDERAEVGNLTRSIVIQAPDDDAWKNDGFGAHTMIMPGSSARIEGVEFRRTGQQGRLRRYAFHWHMLSYSGPDRLPDATGQYIRNSSVNSSKNRGIVIHGTNGVEVRNNVLYDILGHGIFTEDAVERRNVISGNLVLHVRNQPYETALKQHETGERGASGFWISNPDNEVTNNVAADCGTNGFWLAFPQNPFGLSKDVLADDGELINPSRIEFGTFDRNVAHSNRLEGIMLDNPEVDELGNTEPFQYWSTTDGREAQWPFATLRRFTLSRYVVWKNGSNGIWDRSVWPDNYEVVSADNCGRFFAGSGSDGVIERSLVVGTSLNHLRNHTDRPLQADYAAGFSSASPVAFATYHSTFDIKHNIVINFPLEGIDRSGAFSTDDYYIRSVEKGQIRNENNLVISSHPGVKLKAPEDHFTLASALWDPYGMWGPEGNYVVFDDPFLTDGKQAIEIAPGTASGGVSVEGPFYGFRGFVLHGVGDDPPQNQPYMDLMAIHVSRLDETMTEVASWEVESAVRDDLLNHMRDFATSPEAIYELTFPEEDLAPTDFQMYVENMLETSDTQVIGIQYDGQLDPRVAMYAYSFNETYEGVASLEDVVSSAGATWWQDKAGDRIWVKIRGGFWKFWTEDENEAVPSSDDLLYETTQLRIYVPD